ncbi:hypothetical protein D8801_08075 [Streptococcus oralis]|jgi:hypothetical protein|uniref:Uncharacterized protein n=2 Tax=Streptococcus TaxID=1301 RepID=A0A428FMI4_STROR|nr:hypothetical protein D8852_06965 [Streptococcus mitis]RSJ07620.1 hypothetical protein D8839_05550 [Streptococcus mitis]RSJ62993.1 hypothetical protein D8803_06720 [Streptococcus oralis]RSJ68930.1 hypothetical protein D8801_08075 [Streptococcus oralis]
MIQIIVNAFVEKDKTGAAVENLFASAVHGNVQTKRDELVAQYTPKTIWRFAIYHWLLFSMNYLTTHLCLLEKRSLSEECIIILSLF